jgi:hypothetical protein
VSYFEKRVNTLIRKPPCRCAETSVGFPNFPRVVGKSRHSWRFFSFWAPASLFLNILYPLDWKIEEKIAIRSVFLVYGKLLCLKPKALWKLRGVWRVAGQHAHLPWGRTAHFILIGKKNPWWWRHQLVLGQRNCLLSPTFFWNKGV